MAYCCNVQNNCRFSSFLTKFNRALSRDDSCHSHRHKKGLISVTKKKWKWRGKGLQKTLVSLNLGSRNSAAYPVSDPCTTGRG